MRVEQMAGEIEEPFRLNFQVDSFRSGSISFGRFENEALCWERRSSFSHNRYREEVEKCSKPGSVTEKKAYFEAHFRKKLAQSSSDCQNEIEYQTSENIDISETTGYNEETSTFDGSVYGGEHKVIEYEAEVFGTSFSEPQIGLASDINKNSDNTCEHAKVEEADDSQVEMRESQVSNMANGLSSGNHKNEEKSGACLKEKRSSSPKEKTPSEVKYGKPQVSVGQSRRYTSRNSSKGSENKANKTVPSRSRAEKKTSEAPSKYPMHKGPKYESQHGSEIKGVDEINSSQKGSINRTFVGPQTSTSQKVFQNANRAKQAVGANKPGIRQDTSRFSFKSNEHAQRRKQFDMELAEKIPAKKDEMHQLQTKTQEKTKNEIKLLRKSLNSKAIPIPSFYRGALHEPAGNKYIARNTKPQNLSSKSSSSGARVSSSSPSSARAKTSDPARASGATSSHSTVTSDSNASSPAVTSNGHIRCVVSWKKDLEKEKLTNLRKHKEVPEGNQIYKGSNFVGNQRTRTGRSSFTSSNTSSRTGHVAVGVAS